jgi:hypothetical protein
MDNAEQQALTNATAFLETHELEAGNSQIAAGLGTPEKREEEKPTDLPAVKTEPAPVALKEEAPKPAPAKPGLANAIRDDRAKRTETRQVSEEAKRYKDELSQAQAQIAELKRLAEIDDPLAYARAKKFTPELQAMWGQALLYELKPEVAPQEFRLELYKAQQERKEAERAKMEEQREVEQAEQARVQQIQGYVAGLRGEVDKFAPGSYPESEDWFVSEGEDGSPTFNQDNYVRSLVATANNLAIVANKTGQQADLSPTNVARVLEAEVAKQLKLRDGRVAARRGTKTAPTEQSGKQSAETLSTRAVGGGAPRPAAKTDAERLDRAAAALFATR